MRVQITEVYRDWINSLKDRAGRARIQVRVDRLVNGNPGRHRTLTDGVCELKIDFGPGYRVYYTERSGVVIVLWPEVTNLRNRKTAKQLFRWPRTCRSS